MERNISYQRYHRQMILKIFGETGQQKLLQAKVLVIGAGGLGCSALQYLAAAGVGIIGIVDDDVVALSNLHRQVLYTVTDIGLPKASQAAEKLRALNPEINVVVYNERLTTDNAIAIASDYDLVMDGTDNFASRYLINDACVLLNKPLVYGAVSQFEGQVAIFNVGATNRINYRDLFPHPPQNDEVLNCAEAGVLGVLPGIIGAMQANEIIKLITGIGKPLIHRMVTYNVLNNQIFEVELVARNETRALIPPNVAAFREMDYVELCASTTASFDIDALFFNQLIANGNVTVIDVRALGEMPAISEFDVSAMPLKRLQEIVPQLKQDTIVTLCQTGKKSAVAARQLIGIFGTTKKIYSLQGGILKWKQQYSK